MTRKKFDTTKLHKPSIKTEFTIELRNRFEALQEYDDEERVEEKWQQSEDAYKETVKSVLGYKKKGQKPWISKESWDLVEERKKLKGNIERQSQAESKKTLKKNTVPKTRKSRKV